MNKPQHAHPLNPQIRNEATEWLLRFSEGEVDSAGREQFNYWLRTSPEHVRAYLRVAAFWQEAGHIDGKQGPRDIDALISQAKQEGNVFPLAFGPHPNDRAADRHASSAEELPKAQPRPAAQRFLAIAATLLVAIGVVGAHQYLTRNVYQTSIGEQRTINLADGSTLILNADSKIRVRYSEAERTIDLEQGQALFKVAKNASRPFVVRSGEASVRAVGTQFDVYRKSTGTTVTVVEGKVAVTSEKVKGTGEGQGEEVDVGAVLIAGEQLTIPKISVAQATAAATPDTASAPQVRAVKVAEATAWTEGLLIFDGTPLTEVIREFNRQNSKPLVLEGTPELAQIKITGTFPANGADRITRFLEERFSVAAHETDDHIALTRP
jgi:transmembrane sensor